jgi:chorismate synthase
MIRFTTAGESHGKGLVAVVEGLPAGLRLVANDVNHELRRRMAGYGRGMAPEPDTDASGKRRRRVTRPRPGHADLVGVLKYGRSDARDILERASARETAARVACGAVCRRLLAEFGVAIGSHVVELGPVKAPKLGRPPVPLNETADRSAVRCLDEETSTRMVQAIDEAIKGRDTLGGIAEVVVSGLPVGLGAHVSWDRKLDGRLAYAMMSIPAVKGVEIGLGFEMARQPGSRIHDEIVRGGSRAAGGYARATNRAGGLEGGMTTGEPVVVRVAMKPISTLRRPLATVDIATREPARAQSERSDVTAVPAMGVIAEAMAAIVLAQAMQEKFGGDSVEEMRAAVDHYLTSLSGRSPEPGTAEG